MQNAVRNQYQILNIISQFIRDNLEFCQWFKKFWDEHFPGGEYDAAGRRAGAPGAAATTAASTGPTPRTSSSAGTRRPAKLSGGGAPSAAAEAQIEALGTQMNDLKINFDSLEKVCWRFHVCLSF